MRGTWILLTGLIASTTALAELPRAWIGADRAELIAVLGPPQEIRSDGQGGSVLVYPELRTLEEALDQPAGVDLDAPMHLGTRLYFVDATGKIYGKLDTLTL